MDIFSIETNGIVKKLKKMFESSNASNDNTPQLFTVSQYSSNNTKIRGYNSNLNFVTTFKHFDSASGDGEAGNNYWAHSRTNIYASSYSNSGSLLPFTSILGHCSLNMSVDGKVCTHRNASLDGQLTVGTWVNSKSRVVSLHLKNNKIYTTRKSIEEATIALCDKNNDLQSNDYMLGTIGYNEKTKVLAIADTNGSYQTRLIIYKNVKSPLSFKTETEFYQSLQNPIITDYFTNIPIITGGSEHQKRGVVVVADNGDIFVTKMIPSHGMYIFRVDYDQENDAYSIPSDVLWQDHYTTTYGMEQGNMYGIRFNITYDQKKVVIYSSSYYYGSGYISVIIDVESSMVLTGTNKDATYGYQFIPYKDDMLIVNKSQNADGNNQMVFYMLDLKKQFEQKNNLDAFDLGQEYKQILNNGYYSTDYPYIIPNIFYNKGE